MRGCAANGSLNDSNFGKPLPTIGLYVAGASLCCAAAMAVDTFRGFRGRRLWFPSKYFTLNAATLTVLAVATKLPVDINTSMPRPIDQLAKLSGTVLICTVMGNLMPSLGVTKNAASNIVALGILVVTVIVNVGIQMGTGVIYVYLFEHAVIVFSMLVLLILLISSALTVPTTKRQLEKQYNIKHQELYESEGDADVYKFTGTLEERVKKYWLLAHSSSPQYVLGRSATCTASGAFCLLSALILAEASARSFLPLPGRSSFCTGTSDYEWSIILVFLSQAIAVVVGTIAPAIRWFTAVSFWRPEAGSWRWSDEFRVEKYWVEKLTVWKEAPLYRLEFGNRRCWRIVHSTKNLILDLLLKIQMGVVLASKVVRLMSILPVSWLNRGTKWFRKLDAVPSSVGASSNLEEFVLHLEGEKDLVKLITRNERMDTARWIEKGKKKSPVHLASLIRDQIQPPRGGQRFMGVGHFDSSEVVSLAPEGGEPSHCWALPVVTLASIAVALPGVNQSSLKRLLSAVDEGLRYVRQIEWNLEAKGLLNQRNAADVLWSSLSLYNRWFDLDLHRLAAEHQSSRKAIEQLKHIGETCVREFLEKGRDGFDKMNSLEWPPNVLAANCMYRLTSTILQHCCGNPGMEAKLFHCWLQPAILDLLGACLTNLPRAILRECFCNAMEVGEDRVRGAAFLLGEAMDIMSQLAEVERSYPKETTYVDNWREKIGNGSEWSLDLHTPSSLSSDSSNTMSSLTSISSSFTANESVRSGELSQREGLPEDIV